MHVPVDSNQLLTTSICCLGLKEPKVWDNINRGVLMNGDQQMKVIRVIAHQCIKFNNTTIIQQILIAYDRV